MEIDGWNYLGSNFKTFHNQQGSGTPEKSHGVSIKYIKLGNTERSRNRNIPYSYNINIINKFNQNI